MNIIADLHTHTIASTHAYNTILEMVRYAAQVGLKAIALTDHGRRMPGAPGDWFFQNLVSVPRRLEGILVLRGIELNIIDYDGNTDLEENARDLDWAVASIHNGLLDPSVKPTVERCTELWLKVAQNPMVRVIGHSGTPQFEYDYETVIPEFGRQGKLVEINEHSFLVRKASIPNCKKIAETCKKYGVPIVIDSDAHFCTEMGVYSNAEWMLREIDFPEELIVNADENRLYEYLRKYTKVLDEE